jgi:hypothetical protein
MASCKERSCWEKLPSAFQQQLESPRQGQSTIDMTEADLNRIETSLGVALPGRYRKFALRLPNSPDHEYACKWYPFMDVDEIINRNQEFRSGGRVDDWKPELFCIGTFEGGDFFVDLGHLEKGVFVENSNSGSDELGGRYDPNDYSSCWVQSFDDLVDQLKGAPWWQRLGTRLASVVWQRKRHLRNLFNLTWRANGNFHIRRRDDPSPEMVEEEIRRIAAELGGAIRCSFDPEATYFTSVDLEIIGGPDGVSIEASSSGERFHFFDASAAPEPVVLIRGEPGEEVGRSGQEVCRDIERVIEAARYYAETGKLLPSFPWRKRS